MGKPVGSVVSAVRILRYLATVNGTVRGSKVAQELGINTSTCFNILQTLAAENLVRFDPDSKRYRLGYGLLDLASSNAIMGGDKGGIRAAMQRVSDRHGVTMSLWRRISENRLLMIVVTSSAIQTRVHMSVGQRLPLLVGSIGRAMAGALRLSEAELRHFFQEVRWIRPVSFEAYCQEVQLAVERGWALDAGDFVSGLHSLSAPVVDGKGAPLLICTATMFSGQYSDKIGEEIGRTLINLATEVQPMALGLQ
jgi:DNA-binding IclR family transcriptional regulator